MIYFAACPKCQGDVTLSRDSYGNFLSCLQCGLMCDVASKPTAVAKPKPVAPALFEEREELPMAA